VRGAILIPGDRPHLRLPFLHSLSTFHVWHLSETDSRLPLPNRFRVEIARRKVTGYLLATAHPVGGAKARYFESRGYSIEEPQKLEDALRQVAAEGTVAKENATRWGIKFVVEGSVIAPDGNPLPLATVWIVKESSVPVLVTAYPIARKP